MDNVSSTIQDQHSYNKKIESQLAQLAAALPVATNLEKVKAITTRGGSLLMIHHIQQGQVRHQW